MTGRKVLRRKQRVKLLTLGFDGVLRIVQWLVLVRLEQIEEVALGSLEPVTETLSMEEATEAVIRIMGGSAGKTERKTIENYLRVQVMEWWRDYPERELLTRLFEQAARRKAGVGSPDSRRRPRHSDGLRVAKPMLVDIPDTGRLDAEWESGAVSKVLAALLLPPIGTTSPETVQRYFELSETSKIYSDALEFIEKELDRRSEAMPPLFMLQNRAVDRRRLAWQPKPKAAHRPVNPATLLRDIQIQIVIEFLRRVGIKPRGTYVSGCRIAAEASGLAEETVKDIWEMKFTPAMEKHSRVIAKRTGPFHTTVF